MKRYWSVSTEGDCEGHTTRQLGVYYGHIDEVALHLADKQYYSLSFAPLPDPQDIILTVTRKSACISLSAGSREELVSYLKDRPVEIRNSNQYKTVTIYSTSTDVLETLDAAARKKALEKLTAEERKLLGL